MLRMLILLFGKSKRSTLRKMIYHVRMASNQMTAMRSDPLAYWRVCGCVSTPSEPINSLRKCHALRRWMKGNPKMPRMKNILHLFSAFKSAATLSTSPCETSAVESRPAYLGKLWLRRRVDPVSPTYRQSVCRERLRGPSSPVNSIHWIHPQQCRGLQRLSFFLCSQPNLPRPHHPAYRQLSNRPAARQRMRHHVQLPLQLYLVIFAWCSSDAAAARCRINFTLPSPPWR